MRFEPALVQTTAAHISAGGLCVAETPSGAGALFLRVADSDDAIAVVQIAPRSSELNWLGTLDPDAVVCDVTETAVLAYDVDPANLRFPDPDDLSALVPGDLLIDGKTTKLVCVGPNPATGIGFVDLDTGVLSSGIGQNPMLVLSWTLVPGFTPS